ncbi:IS3 family transposase [Paenibacillus larvae]|uniref:IS3 family transposase n=1 Tax=Paenibacillus larvae TaxID=1464 RepID=UPI00293CCB96|nr:IS3 family transposase [Paenibacillus larvae]
MPWWINSHSRVIVSQCFVKSLMYPEVGFTNGSEDVVRLLETTGGSILKGKDSRRHQRLRGILGYPRMRIWLKKTYGIHVNHKRVYRLMKQMGIQAQIRKKKRYYDKKEVCVVSDNVLNRDFHATRPNEKWVTDITYIPYKQKNLYLSAICDLFNNEIIAFHLSTRNDLQLVIDTLEKAQKSSRRGRQTPDLSHHRTYRSVYGGS